MLFMHEIATSSGLTVICPIVPTMKKDMHILLRTFETLHGSY